MNNKSAQEVAQELVWKISDAIINPLIFLFIGVAVIYFLWGIFLFVRDSDSETGRTKGRHHMIWGLVGLTVMISAYGIYEIIKRTVAG